MDRDFYFSHNVPLEESLDRHKVTEDLVRKCGDEAKVGPAFESGRFIDAPKLVGIYVRDGAGTQTLQQAKAQAYREKTGIPCHDR